MADAKVLYHGSSTKRLKSIVKENRLRILWPGDRKVWFTTGWSVAEYWACHAVFGDRHNRPNVESSGVVLVVDGESLSAHGHDLTEFQDAIWGEGEPDRGNEVACWEDIAPWASS
jgi:RNA:NAD 2'-phosphotransferase (TPT1/KptA family)